MRMTQIGSSDQMASAITITELSGAAAANSFRCRGRVGSGSSCV